MEPVELTILSLCDLLQDLLIENGMEDMPVLVGVHPTEGYDPLAYEGVRVGRNGVFLG